MTKCPMCGYSEPAQNTFKPNVMSEYYIPKTKETVVLNDNEHELDHPIKGKMIRKDVHLQREREAALNKPAAPIPVSKTPPPPATVSKPAPAPVAPVKSTVLPAKPIPASMVKSPAEIAATPKSAVTATPVPEVPIVANIVPTVEGQP